MRNCYSILIQKTNNSWLEWDDFSTASKNLSSSALRVYIFLCAEENLKVIRYSPKILQEELGISESSSHRAFKELVEKGYLSKDCDSFYIFHRAVKKNT